MIVGVGGQGYDAGLPHDPCHPQHFLQKLLSIIEKAIQDAECWMRFCCIFWLCFDLFVNPLIGFSPYVENYAHMGDLIYGLLVALTILE
jgi:hypothetical protein